jgi:hypothetical protein
MKLNTQLQFEYGDAPVRSQTLGFYPTSHHFTHQAIPAYQNLQHLVLIFLEILRYTARIVVVYVSSCNL